MSMGIHPVILKSQLGILFPLARVLAKLARRPCCGYRKLRPHTGLAQEFLRDLFAPDIRQRQFEVLDSFV